MSHSTTIFALAAVVRIKSNDSGIFCHTTATKENLKRSKQTLHWMTCLTRNAFATHHLYQWVVAIVKNESVILAWHGKWGRLWHCPFTSACPQYAQRSTWKTYARTENKRIVNADIPKEKNKMKKNVCASLSEVGKEWWRWLTKKKFRVQNDFTNNILMPLSFWSIHITLAKCLQGRRHPFMSALYPTFRLKKVLSSSTETKSPPPIFHTATA